MSTNLALKIQDSLRVFSSKGNKSLKKCRALAAVV
jgi:hypothetical protein